MMVLGAVLAASALNLALGAAWLAALAGVWAIRRRVPIGAGAVLGVVAALGVVGADRGWFEPPPAASYGEDEADWLRRHFWGGHGAPAGPGFRDTLAARLATVAEEERQTPAIELERRAAAAVALVRGLERLRGRAAGQVSALETAVRRLAFTLTSPEFRNLDARRARSERYLMELAARLDLAQDDAELEAISRALDPAVLATVTLRAVREDLARVDEATRAVFRALGGGNVTVTATSVLAVDDVRGEAATEVRYRMEAAPPARITRIEPAGLHPLVAGDRGRRQVTVAVDGGPPRQVSGAGAVGLEVLAHRIEIVDHRARSAVGEGIRTPLRRIPFSTLRLDPGRAAGRLLVTLQVDGAPGAEALLPVDLPAARLLEVAAPPRALFWVGAPGTLQSTDALDVWRVATSEAFIADGLRVELAPPMRVFRNPAFAALRPYLYQPSLAASLTLVGLAALTAVLASRRRTAAPGSG
ncbi:MAG: hypothetical protein DMD79_15015 [Candidatus Rokuibacteriota bacterium]|nr:MAG: hypothetical protein DMD79_15015 [Candidatus Rokubacteria bacterium]